ncbi:MAG TPA: DNA mismatch repair endonuclease MutL, partial [Myxococcota bacterium]|nr:DNA mismatch repair endonuclease MutL [Myxococcota bacterium]
MARVRILPSELVNQIAAGEVVERPASVVKELVENSLDAGATQIRVAIREGGVASIAVVDDGAGMSREDAELAFQRHATSKLATLGDLERIETLGFRGEALPSIASVARVRMCTRRRGDALGSELNGDGAGIASVAPIACSEGTAIEVAELFGRVPARLKFLKGA